MSLSKVKIIAQNYWAKLRNKKVKKKNTVGSIPTRFLETITTSSSSSSSLPTNESIRFWNGFLNKYYGGVSGKSFIPNSSQYKTRKKISSQVVVWKKSEHSNNLLLIEVNWKEIRHNLICKILPVYTFRQCLSASTTLLSSSRLLLEPISSRWIEIMKVSRKNCSQLGYIQK